MTRAPASPSSRYSDGSDFEMSDSSMLEFVRDLNGQSNNRSIINELPIDIDPPTTRAPPPAEGSSSPDLDLVPSYLLSNSSQILSNSSGSVRSRGQTRNFRKKLSSLGNTLFSKQSSAEIPKELISGPETPAANRSNIVQDPVTIEQEKKKGFVLSSKTESLARKLKRKSTSGMPQPSNGRDWIRVDDSLEFPDTPLSESLRRPLQRPLQGGKFVENFAGYQESPSKDNRSEVGTPKQSQEFNSVTEKAVDSTLKVPDNADTRKSEDNAILKKKHSKGDLSRVFAAGEKVASQSVIILPKREAKAEKKEKKVKKEKWQEKEKEKKEKENEKEQEKLKKEKDKKKEKKKDALIGSEKEAKSENTLSATKTNNTAATPSNIFSNMSNPDHSNFDVLKGAIREDSDTPEEGRTSTEYQKPRKSTEISKKAVRADTSKRSQNAQNGKKSAPRPKGIVGVDDLSGLFGTSNVDTQGPSGQNTPPGGFSISDKKERRRSEVSENKTENGQSRKPKNVVKELSKDETIENLRQVPSSTLQSSTKPEEQDAERQFSPFAVPLGSEQLGAFEKKPENLEKSGEKKGDKKGEKKDEKKTEKKTEKKGEKKKDKAKKGTYKESTDSARMKTSSSTLLPSWAKLTGTKSSKHGLSPMQRLTTLFNPPDSRSISEDEGSKKPRGSKESHRISTEGFRGEPHTLPESAVFSPREPGKNWQERPTMQSLGEIFAAQENPATIGGEREPAKGNEKSESSRQWRNKFSFGFKGSKEAKTTKPKSQAAEKIVISGPIPKEKAPKSILKPQAHENGASIPGKTPELVRSPSGRLQRRQSGGNARRKKGSKR